jgi:hypothetical protein
MACYLPRAPNLQRDELTSENIGQESAYLCSHARPRLRHHEANHYGALTQCQVKLTPMWVLPFGDPRRNSTRW